MIKLEDAPRFDKRAYQREYNKTRNGVEAKKKYRHNNSKHTTDAKYLSKRFVAIDGEGINIRRGRRRGEHLYVMLAVSDKQPLINPNGLHTKEMLDYLWESLSSKDINVIYGGSYDFNLIIKDLIEDEVRALYKSSYTSEPLQYEGYGLRWIKGKSFEISKGFDKDKEVKVINDVISFFQRPFIAACDEYLGEYEGRDELVREKAKRGNFRIEDLTGISHYNQLELRLLVRLMQELRLRLNKVGLRPRRWNSPGAIASALFLREGVKKHRNENLPAPVMQAARFAYAGGRFEMLKYGSVTEKVYEYDINSAYPRALLEVPTLVGGKWHHTRNKAANKHHAFALYKVRFSGTDSNIPAPIFCRAENGTITYPLTTTNWIWSPEFDALKEYCNVIEGASFEVLECWAFTPVNDYKPFAFVADLYKKRQILKDAKDGAEVGIKLALNSLYGKLAQQVGWLPATSQHPARVPTYHQLEWAGFVTSWCRAHVLRAALQDPTAVIAFETDALFTSRPLKLDTGSELGQWKETVFTSLTYVQSGHYYGSSKRKEIVRCRGIDKGFISRKNVEDLLGLPESQRILEAKLTRFYGAGIALARGLHDYWCKWLTEPKFMQLRPTGKRIHGNCWCSETGPLELGQWHLTYCPIVGGESHEYPVEWINPNEKMSELSELREAENYFDN